MERKDEQSVDAAISFTIQLYEILRNMNIRDHTGEWLWFLHGGGLIKKEQKSARALMDKIVRIIKEQNNQVSDLLIYHRIVYELLQKAIWYTKEYPDFPSSAKDEINALVDYKASRIMDIPLEFLASSGEPTRFGLMKVIEMTEGDWKERWGENITNSGGQKNRVRAYARVEAIGDVKRSRENAMRIITDMLIFLRAIGFPITVESKNQFGILNEHAITLLPYRITRPKENHRLEFSPELSTEISSLRTYEIREDILNQISPQALSRTQRLIEEDYANPSTELKQKFFLALRWLGEATRSDVIEARFVKLFLSLESLIGGEINDSRETKKILSKRCAALAGKTVEEKEKIYNAVLRYYKTRSEIVHGDKTNISSKDFSEFGELVRKITWSMLDLLDRFDNIEKFDEWVLNG